MMKRHYIILLGVLFLFACDGKKFDISELFSAKSRFDKPFPKRGKNLTLILGQEFSIGCLGDTLDFVVKFDYDTRKNHIILKQLNDSTPDINFFDGLVSKYRGLYYFSEQRKDSTYWIHAVEIKNGQIRGFLDNLSQMKDWDQKFDSIMKNPALIIKINSPVLKFVDTAKGIIGLTPDKKAIREFYEPLVENLRWHPIIYESKLDSTLNIDNEKTISKPQGIKKDNEIVNRLYPNPAAENFTLELTAEGSYYYDIIDINGKVLQNGQLTGKSSVIDISNLKTGTYFIRVSSKERENFETIKMIKK